MINFIKIHLSVNFREREGNPPRSTYAWPLWSRCDLDLWPFGPQNLFLYPTAHCKFGKTVTSGFLIVFTHFYRTCTNTRTVNTRTAREQNSSGG